MEDPSDGGDATSAALKGAAASVKSAKDATSPAPVKAEEDRPDEIQFVDFSELPVAKAEGVAKSDGVALPLDAHVSPAPVKADEDRPVEIEFVDFTELPVAKADGDAVSLDAHTAQIMLYGSNSDEANVPKSNNLKRGYSERIETDSPKRSKPCIDDGELNLMLYGCLAKSDENVDVKGNFKRAVADVSSDDSDSSPKRTRVESIRRVMAAVTGGDIQDDISEDTDTANTVVAASPIDRGLKFANALLRLAKSVKERSKSLNKREVSLDKREGSLDKREGTLDKREVSLDKREARVERLEANAGKKSDDEAATKPASNVAQKVEKSIDAIVKADTYTTVVEKMANIPKRGSDFVRNYNENKMIAQDFMRKHNKAIAEKVKSYLSVSASTGAVCIAKTAVLEGLRQVLDLEDDEDGDADSEKAGPLEGDKAGPLEGDKAGPLEGDKAGPLERDKAGPLEGDKAGPLEGDKAGPLEGDKACSSEAVAEPAGATEADSRK